MAVAREEDLWVHVDGAYGVPAAMVEKELFAGLAEVDSLSLDAHKWLYQPLDCSLLLYRDRAAARRTFSMTDDYAASLTSDPIEGDVFFEETIELSRRIRALKLWLSLRYHGLGGVPCRDRRQPAPGPHSSRSWSTSSRPSSAWRRSR